MKKILVCVMGLFILCFSVAVQAQDFCDNYFDRYRVCVEAREAGSNVDYEDCGTHTNETDCTNAGCFWNDQGVPFPGTCVVDFCLADSDLSGMITGADLTMLKRDLGRVVPCLRHWCWCWNIGCGWTGHHSAKVPF